MKLDNLATFDPSTCISGKMMRMSRVTASIFRKHLSPFGVTNSQLTLLFILSKRDGLNQKQLSEIAVLEKSSLNRNLTRLVDAGYVSKAEFPIIMITEAGKTLVNDVIPEWRKAMIEIEAKLESDGLQALGTLSAKLLT
ncbi:MAG: MarR family winged helix-turn-helix transcriptional regulator [Cryomorphaceae bacterium]